MSNKSAGIETRNKRRQKASPEPLEKRQEEQPEFKIVNCKLSLEKDEEEGQPEQTKKLKTENNSESKNLLLFPRNGSHNIHAHESLQLLRTIASENSEL